MDAQSTIKSFIMENFVLGRDATTDIGAGDSLSRLGLIDSTGVLELIAFLESKFGIAVTDDETVPENLDSIEQIANFVARKQAAQ
jgi:acyl carrier protein